MDQYALQKLGNVTIEKIPPKAEVSNDANVSVSTKEPSAVSISSGGIQLPKLPPSINITIKPNPLCAESPVSDENVDDKAEELQYSDHYQEPSSTHPEIETKDAEDDPSNLSSPGDSSEICDNLTESKNNEDVEADCQELSESLDDEETEFSMADSAIDDKMECKESEEKESVDKEYEDEAELPEVKEEFVGTEEYGEGDDLPEVPVDELIEGEELAESVICKEEEFSDKESDTTSDDADDELDDGQQTDEAGVAIKRKKKRKTKPEDGEDESSNGSKKQKTSEKTEDEEKETTTSELKVGNLRRNIREVMDETKLDEATLSAQMQEKERLRRVQEQLRANRDIQRQMMQARVLSLIETGGTSISYRDPEEYSDVEEQKPNTVVVKLHSGSGPQRMLDLLKKQKTSSDSEEDDASLDKFASLSRNLSKPQMMTSSVSIAPVKHEPKMTEIKHETEDEELMEPADEDDKPKNKDIVMISSSSSSSSGEDDDCIVISEDEESEPEEDTGNSGMHTNDLYNVPDEQGRVLINVGHSENEEDVFLAPQIARIIKPHQIGGVRFLFDNIVESLSRFTTSEGFGCILAHSMGLGKTLQVVSFCDVFLRYTEGRSVLCIMPINTLQNWVAEFNMWLPVDPETSPLKDQGEVSSRHFPLFVLNDNQKSLTARARVIQNWYKEGGVLLIGYELYRQLCLKKSPKARLRSKKKEIEEDIDDEKSKSLLEIMYNALVKPGPDLVICDEGHRIKNSHASISHALKQIRSKRRVVLTGYPLQNNLLEYWCMVDFVRPNYLGTKTEFSNMFERPIQNGQCIDSTPQDVKLMRYRAHVLHSLLEGFVQRRSHRVLQQTLPKKYEFVMLLKLTSFQKKLYNTFMNEVVRTKAVPNPLKAFAVCCKIWNHPDILHYFLKKRAGEEDIDLDLDETVPIGTPASDSSSSMTPSTSPLPLASKRGRTPRKPKDKPPRKNARTSTPQPINKPPSMAPIPPNTASNPKPLNPEHAITNANNQPIPPFNSYNNQFQNFNQPSNENSNFNQSSSTSQNFGSSQFSQSEYSPNPGANNAEYNNVNFQQNYNEGGNYYQSEYDQQNNYWPGANNDENHFYNANSNNSAAPTTDNFYPSSNSSSSSSSQSTTQSYSNEFSSSQGESSQSDYGGQNFNYPNQSMQQFSREFPAAKQDMGGMQNYSNHSNMDSGIVSDTSSMYQSEVARGDVNFGAQHQSPGSNLDGHHFAGQNVHNDGMSYNAAANREMYPSSGNVDLTGAEQNAFDSFTPPPMPKSRRGRPPSQNPRAIASRQKRANAKAASLALAAQNASSQGGNFPPPMFKPGLLGGAPLKTGNPQSFSADQPNPNVQSSPHMFQSNDMNQNYPHGQMNMQAMRGEMWNAPPNNQNAVFADQDYGMYNEMPQQSNSNFIPNEAPPMMNEASAGGARSSRNLLNDIQPNEIFNPPEGGYPPSGADSNIFNLDNFNFLPLNDIPMAGHTSFMGLLEGVDSMEMGQASNVPAAAPPPASQAMGSSAESAAGNYMESGMQYQAANANTNPMPVSTMTSTAISNKDSPYSETVGLGDLPATSSSSSCRDVSDSLMGLARKGQITLKKVNKKNENLRSPPAKSDAEFAQGRLPSMEMFNSGGASQNFAGSGSAESGNFGQSGGQYGFAKGQSTSSSSATSTQTNWESYGGYQNEFNAAGMVDKGQNFGNFSAANSSSLEAQRNKSKTMAAFEQAPSRMGTQTENYDSAPTRDGPCKDQLSAQPANSSVLAVNVKKQPEDEITRNFYQTTNSGTENDAKNVFGTNVGASGSPVKIEKNLMPQKRNPLIIPPSEVFKPENLKSESQDDDSKMGPPETPASKSNKEEPGIPYDWAVDFFKDYSPGKIEASAKTLVFFTMLDEIIRLGDRLLLFSQSLFTLDLLEDFLHMFNIPNTEEKWARNKNYFRLDGSTSALEREKLINEFNQNPNVHLFLVSTRAGSLGINLVGANRVVVFDASWNPCHDTQAVCRVYRYGQQKPCYVYRFVMDHCLEKKIYDRQINKQGLSDRIVDECNPDAHLTIKDVANLCWDDVDLTENNKDFNEFIDKYEDVVMKKVIKECGAVLSKEPFQHESLLVDRADKKLSQAEKRMAKRGYELEKQASLKPTYGLYTPLNMQNRMKPTASVRPMPVQQPHQRETVRRWIPAEVWQKQGMSAQEMTLPLDVVIPTGTADNRSEIKLDAGQKVIVLKSPKGIYMQLENGKIIAIKAALKPDGGPVPGKPPSSIPGQPPDPAQMVPKMPLKPPVDQNLAALSARRGVTVSPIRQRFPMRPQPNIGMPNMPLRPQGFNRPPPRPSQPPMPRPFSQASRSPQGRSPSRGLRPPSRLQPPQKPLFGPNSAVSISVANQKNMESQMRGPMGVDQPLGRGPSLRPVKDEYARNPMKDEYARNPVKNEYARNYEKEGPGHLTEVAYDDYASGPLREPMPRSMNEARKASNPINDYSSASSMDSGYGSRPPYGHPPSRDGRNASQYPPNQPRPAPSRSDALAESLKYKKDINLTPVAKNPPPKMANVDKSPAMLDPPKPKLPQVPYHQQQQHPQHSQPYQMSQANKVGPPKQPSHGVPRRPPPMNLAPDVKVKKEAPAPAKGVELPKSSAISIFPVGKKGEDTPAFQQEQQSTYPASQAKGDFYGQTNYAPKQPFAGGNYSSESPQFSHQYDSYKQKYQPGFAGQSEYSSTQPSFSSGQYPSNYPGEGFAGSSYPENSSQYSNASMYANQSSSSQNYDQYGSYYNYAQKESAPSRASSSQSTSQ